MTRTNTRTINEAVENKLAVERELLDSEVGGLVRNLKDVKPIFYYHRMIADCFLDSKFSHEIGKNYDVTDKSLIRERNKCIAEAIKDNLGEDITSVEISPDICFKNVYNALTRNDKGHGIAVTGLTREKLFLCALVFNLQYDNFIELMKRCIGECGIDYSDPYETLLAYCMIEHTSVYSRYMELKKTYEEGKENESIKDKKIAKFSDIETDDDLLSFVRYSLSTGRRYHNLEIFNEIYNEICDDFNIDPTNCLAVTRAIYGDNLRVYDDDPIPHIKSKVFYADNLKAMLNGESSVTKEAMLILLFVKYTSCWSDKLECTRWENAVDFANSSAADGKLKCIYRDFKSFANEELRAAGFQELYLPNALESLLVYCLAVELDPLETFQIMFSSEKTFDDIMGIIERKGVEKKKA